MAVHDGSLRNPKIPELRVGGWAVVGEHEGQLFTHYGAVPLPRPTSLAAELRALLMCLRLAGESLEEVVTDCATVVRGLQRGKTWTTASSRPQAHIWMLIWEKLDDLMLVPGDNLTVTKVKAHKTKAAKQQLEQRASRGLHLEGTAQARKELRLTVLNERADEWAKKGAKLDGPPNFVESSAFEKLDECKGILEYIAHFRAAMVGHKSTTWEPVKGKGARAWLREARQKRSERLLARRLQRGRQHSFVQTGRYIGCTRCNRRAYTESGKRKLELQECSTVIQGHWRKQQNRAAAKTKQKAAQRIASIAEGREVHSSESGSSSGTVGVAKLTEGGQHRLAQLGQVTFCITCGCYAQNVSRKLLDSCMGKPVTNSEADRSRRQRRKKLLQGLHPATGLPIPGIQPGQHEQASAPQWWYRSSVDCPSPNCHHPPHPLSPTHPCAGGGCKETVGEPCRGWEGGQQASCS